MASSLIAFSRNVHSQNGEDGILAEVFRRLGIADREGIFVDVGAGDGVVHSNTLALLERGWRGVLVDDNPENVAILEERRVRLYAHQAIVVHLRVGRHPIDGLDVVLGPYRAAGLEPDFDFLSIDVDSHDLEIFQQLSDFRPKVVCVEVNSSVPLGVRQVHGGGQGASFSSMLAVGTAKGYRLACHTGNMIFVRRELFDRLGLPAEEAENPDSLFSYNGPPFTGGGEAA